MNRRYSDQLAVIRANMARSVQSGIRMVTQRLGLNRQPIAELRVVSGPMTGSTLPIGSDVVWVGRDPSQCEVVLMSDPYISSRHFQITRDPATQQFYILDEGTANGTRVNRVPLQIKTRTPLPEDAEIEVGMTKLVFQQGRRTQRLNV
jgi:pSer/pThr/pTyr-binding forkhead associated (FHA) protein